ncbi:MAG: DUF229 domain-containing protein [Bacteroidetes bacterium]|nr:MAG: DUF229 domain-containing protein [Bacteroidota bacterium]
MNPSRYWLLLATLLLSCQPEPPAGPLNVLFIAVDDLRPEFGAYGATHIQAPNLDRLAAEGVLFERAYCNVPVCGSSRASLLSGMRPGWRRFPGAYNTYLSEDAPEAISLPRHFRQHGYHTLSLGKVYHHADDDTLAWDTVWRPRPRNESGGRDYHTAENIALNRSRTSRGLPYERAPLPDSTYYDGRIANEAIASLERLAGQDQPFFLAVGFLKPHLPFNAPEKYWALYDSLDIQLPASYQQPASTPREAFHSFGELRNYAAVPKEGPVPDRLARTLIHGYYAAVSYTDAQIGKLLSALEEKGLAERTVVVLWGDHGWNLGEHQLWCKHCNFETALRVPMLLRIPGETPGKRISAITELIDLYPTLTDLAGLPQPTHLDGESLLPLLRGEGRAKDYAVAKYWAGATLIRDHWFYTEWINDSAEIQASMLFDHRRDAQELHNLTQVPGMEDTVQALHTFLRAHWGDAFFPQPDSIPATP